MMRIPWHHLWLLPIKVINRIFDTNRFDKYSIETNLGNY